MIVTYIHPKDKTEMMVVHLGLGSVAQGGCTFRDEKGAIKRAITFATAKDRHNPGDGLKEEDWPLRPEVVLSFEDNASIDRLIETLQELKLVAVPEQEAVQAEVKAEEIEQLCNENQ